MTGEGVRAAFTALRERTGMSMSEFARTLGYAGSSSIQPYKVSGNYDRDYLPEKLIRRMRDTLVGFGKPPITSDEIAHLGSASLFAKIGVASSIKAIGPANSVRGATIKRILVALVKHGYIRHDDAHGFANDMLDLCEYLERTGKFDKPEAESVIGFAIDRSLSDD